ncbi:MULTISPECIES: cupin domain-containing protein [unclassified Lonepinella]|uniref:cupin domain-containing protein n=2 Tax=unclassified Lonepinella TaxID=2642006 RepID=UPI0036DAC761
MMKKVLSLLALTTFALAHQAIAQESNPATIKIETGTQAGKVLTEKGRVFVNQSGTVVHGFFKAGDKMKRHNHDGYELFFTVLKGKANIVLDDKENHPINAGEILYFNGKHFINADFPEETEVLISLIKE